MVFVAQKGQKIMPDSFHYSSTNGSSLYVFLLYIKSAARLFDLHDSHQGDIDICIKHLQIVCFVYISDLSTLTKYSLISYFSFMPIIDNFVLFILFTILFGFIVQIADTFSEP